MDGQASMEHERPASVVSEQPSKSPRLTRNYQKWGSLKDEIQRIYKLEGETLATTMRTIEESHGFKARSGFGTSLSASLLWTNAFCSVRKWKMQLKAWNFDKNVSAMDMGIVAAKAEKRAREEGKETIFFHGDSQISSERIEYFKRRKTTKLADAASPSAGRFQILLALARLYAELSRLTDTPTNITYYTPGPVSDEPSFELPAGKSTPLTEEPIIPEAISEGSASALSIEEIATSSVTLQPGPYPSSNPGDNPQSWLVHSGAMVLSDEEPISTRPLQNSRPTQVGTPLLNIKQLGSPPPPKGGHTIFEKELGVNPADIMGSQLDSLSLKENQPKTTPDPEVGMSSPVQSSVKPAVYRSIPSAAATGGEIHKLQNLGGCSEAYSASSFALFKAVSSVYPYTEDKMSPMLRVRRVKKIIVNLIHDVEQGHSFECAISNLRTYPEPFPVGKHFLTATITGYTSILFSKSWPNYTRTKDFFWRLL
jgi:hypothetical protein